MGEHDQTLDKDAYRSIHDEGRKLPPIRREEYFHQYDDYANPIPDSEYLPTYAHQAFLFSRKELIPEIVYVHGDKFTPTEWEAQFSNLTESGDEQSFAPVVDDDFRVVGHLGWIDGKHICVPKKTIAEGFGSPYAAELEKARLFGAHWRLVSSHYSIVDSRFPGFPGQPVSAAPTKRPAPCWPANKPPALSLPNPKDEEALWNSLLEAPGKDVSEEQRRLGNLNFFLAGGGKAVVGFKFGWNLVPREQWQVRQHLDYPIYSYPFDTYLMISGCRFQVLVAPDGHIQAVVGVEKYRFELPEEKVLRVAFKIIDIALTVWMIIDIFTIPVALFRLGAMVAERAAIRGVQAIINEAAKAALDAAAKAAAKEAAERAAREVAASIVKTGGKLSAEEMIAHLTNIVRQHPELRRLMAARVLTAQRLTSATLEALGDWARAGGRRVVWKTEAEMVKVTKDAKNLMTLQGNELWINEEAKALKEAMEFYKEVVHELASDSLGYRGTGMAKRFIEMPNEMTFTDQTLLENAVMRGDIEGVVRFFAGG